MTMSISPVAGISLERWAESLTNDFPRDIIPRTTGEDSWRSWGNIVASSPTFAAAGVPLTDSFATWREWAERLYALLG